MYFTITPENANFIPIYVGIFVIELLVPVASGLVKGIPFHRHHVIERYGPLNIIALGEVLLSISFMFDELYEGHFDWALVSAAVAGTSPGCIGRNSLMAVIPRACSTAWM